MHLRDHAEEALAADVGARAERQDLMPARAPRARWSQAVNLITARSSTRSTSRSASSPVKDGEIKAEFTTPATDANLISVRHAGPSQCCAGRSGCVRRRQAGATGRSGRTRPRARRRSRGPRDVGADPDPGWPASRGARVGPASSSRPAGRFLRPRRAPTRLRCALPLRKRWPAGAPRWPAVDHYQGWLPDPGELVETQAAGRCARHIARQ